MGRVVIVGSLNLDRWARVERLPAPGETVTAHESATGPGGKGLNQAVAASRAGATVELIGCVGDDEAGRRLLDVLEAEGIGIAAMAIVTGASTGLAMVWVDEHGANSIVVVGGANDHLGLRSDAHSDLLGALDLDATDVVAAQGETSLAVTEQVFREARRRGARTLLNLAPYSRPSAGLLAETSVLVVNTSEFALLVAELVPERLPHDLSSAPDRLVDAAKAVLTMGPEVVVVTLGADGVVAVTATSVHAIDAHEVPVVDTTGAGDGFVGVFAGELARGSEAVAALRFATAAASLVVQEPGAASSMPNRDRIDGAISGRHP